MSQVAIVHGRLGVTGRDYSWEATHHRSRLFLRGFTSQVVIVHGGLYVTGHDCSWEATCHRS